MNIFVLDENPYIAAKYHCDRHVIKMIVESAQMLSSAYYLDLGITKKSQAIIRQEEVLEKFSNFPREKDGIIKPYGIGFLNHPCTRWCNTSIENRNWLLDLLEGLLLEYRNRYHKIHSIEKIYFWFKSNIPNSIPSNKLTQFALAMPNHLHSDNPVISYRRYYKEYKLFAKWKYEKPEWF